MDTRIYQFSNGNPAEELNDIQSYESSDNRWLWVDVFGPYPKTRDFLEAQFKLDPMILDALSADETRPHTHAHDDGLLVTLRGINLNPGQDPEDMLTIRFWITENLIISCHQQHSLSMKKTQEGVQSGKKIKNPCALFIIFCDHLTEVISETIDQIDEKMDQFEENFEDLNSKELLAELSDTRRQILLIRRYLSPQRDTLYHMQLDDESLFTAKQQAYLREINERITRHIEELDANRDRSIIILEQINNQRSEEMNKRMLVLSIVAAVFLPLSFLTGLLGVNLGGIPGSSSPHAFWILIFSLIFIGAGLWIYFKRKKWVQ